MEGIKKQILEILHKHTSTANHIGSCGEVGDSFQVIDADNINIISDEIVSLIKDNTNTRCDSCKYFKIGYFERAYNTEGFKIKDKNCEHGLCLNPKVSSDYVNDWTHRKNEIALDGLHSTCDEERGDLLVGKRFGCIHWEGKI